MTDRPHELELSPEDMRRLGHKVVDMVVDHLTSLRDRAVNRRATPRQMDGILREPPPEDPMDPEELLRIVEKDVLHWTMSVNHPRFFGYVPSPSNMVAVLADTLAAGWNVFAGTWLASSGPSSMERSTVKWLRDICGYPEPADGIFLSGGSVANLTALAVARRARLGDDTGSAVVYMSDQTHFSVDRALRILGFTRDQIRRIPSDEDYRLRMDALRQAVQEDQAKRRVPFCVVANAGTTNTGAVDPLEEIAYICTKAGMWMHADGAYGAPALLTQRGRELLTGLSSADSIVIDPHKWLFQSFEIGCALVREGNLLRDAFTLTPEYMRDTEVAGQEFNYYERGIQLTRSARALKLWMTIKVYGLRAIRAAIERGFTLAEMAEEELRKSNRWEILAPARFGIVAFRWLPEGAPRARPEDIDDLNMRLVEAIRADGFAFLSSTRLRDRIALRICPINPRTTEDDVRETVRRMERLAKRL